MDIKILEFVEGAKIANGLVVIVDVFRSCSTASYLLNNDAKDIILAASPLDAFKIKKRKGAYKLIGELNGERITGFDLNNSPSEVNNYSTINQSFIFTSTAGIKCAVNASSDNVILAGFTNFSATLKYIKLHDNCTFVAAGLANNITSPEDMLCANIFVDFINNDYTHNINKEDTIRRIMQLRTVNKYTDERNELFKYEDLFLCSDIDRFDFIMRVYFSNNTHRLLKEYISYE